MENIVPERTKESRRDYTYDVMLLELMYLAINHNYLLRSYVTIL